MALSYCLVAKGAALTGMSGERGARHHPDQLGGRKMLVGNLTTEDWRRVVAELCAAETRIEAMANQATREEVKTALIQRTERVATLANKVSRVAAASAEFDRRMAL